MRIHLLVFCLLLAGSAMAGKRNASELFNTARKLDRALEQKDTVFLNKHLSDKLIYGHSNGWIEYKDELKAHLFDGKLVYRSITYTGKMPRGNIEGNTGLHCDEVVIDVLLDGKPVNLKLSVLQVWIFQKGVWRLMGRQSTKVL